MQRIMALLAVGWSPARGLSVVPAPQPQQIEDRFMVGAVALAPVSLEDAASAVRRLGVARVDGMVDPTLAAALKQRTIDEMLRRSDRWVEPDDRMVPGTRLRFREAIEIEFDNGGRSDILMPLEDELVDSALRQALQKLAPVLRAAARCLPREDEAPGPNEPSSSSAGPDGLDGPIDLELIECAVLWSRPGSTHQSLHADSNPNPNPDPNSTPGPNPNPNSDPGPDPDASSSPSPLLTRSLHADFLRRERSLGGGLPPLRP